MKDIQYYIDNFGNLTLQEYQTLYWLLIDECAKAQIAGQDFSNLNQLLIMTSNAITTINLSNAINTYKKEQSNIKKLTK